MRERERESERETDQMEAINQKAAKLKVRASCVGESLLLFGVRVDLLRMQALEQPILSVAPMWIN